MTWVATEVAGGVSGQGLDMAVDADGNAAAHASTTTTAACSSRVRPAPTGRSRRSPTRRPPTPRRPATSRPPRASRSTTRAAWWPPGTTPTASCSPRATTARRSRRSRRSTRSAGDARRWAWPRRRQRLHRLVRRLGREPALRRAGRHRRARGRGPSPTVDPADVVPPPTDGGGDECGADGEIALDIVARRHRVGHDVPGRPGRRSLHDEHRQPGRRHPAQPRPAHEEGGDQIARHRGELGPVQQTARRRPARRRRVLLPLRRAPER